MADLSNSLPQASGPKQNSSPISTNSPTLPPRRTCFPQLAQKHEASWSVTCSVAMENEQQKERFTIPAFPAFPASIPSRRRQADIDLRNKSMKQNPYILGRWLFPPTFDRPAQDRMMEDMAELVPASVTRTHARFKATPGERTGVSAEVVFH